MTAPLKPAAPQLTSSAVCCAQALLEFNRKTPGPVSTASRPTPKGFLSPYSSLCPTQHPIFRLSPFANAVSDIVAGLVATVPSAPTPHAFYTHVPLGGSHAKLAHERRTALRPLRWKTADWQDLEVSTRLGLLQRHPRALECSSPTVAS
ncbi:hypothetical protein E2C01_036766 [Portunus trituberculatus]|uniref:Uncharacterized protein n=1 Tax=Portunus trituberculatus TaxID=210409 RepID=A0A5B7FCZ1_PORTR|nr:hypothetical protein [Portunus trituberculatus]